MTGREKLLLTDWLNESGLIKMLIHALCKSTGKQVFYEKTNAEMLSFVLSIGDSYPLF